MTTPRKQAQVDGLKFYSTGQPCKNQHTATRFTSSGECTECERQRREGAQDGRRARAASWYADNREAKIKTSAAWYAANPETAKAARRRWRDENKPASRANEAKRRTRELNAVAGWDAELTEFVMLEAADLAVRREAVTGFPWDVDHMIPLQARAASGLHVWNNLQVIPSVLNKSKFNKMTLTEPREWLRAT